MGFKSKPWTSCIETVAVLEQTAVWQLTDEE